MYLDHRVMAKISHILEQIDMGALLMDANGNVVLPEGDNRQLTLPDQLRRDPTTPMVYGGVTLIGTEENQPLFICLHGDTPEVRNCAYLCSELINMLLRVDLGHATREQAVRLMLRGEVEGAELESLAAEHSVPLEKNRCVIYFYFTDTETEDAASVLEDAIDPEADILTEVGRHSLALMKAVDDPVDYDELVQLAAAVENTFLMETGRPVYIGISEPRAELCLISEAYEEARDAINIGRVYHGAGSIFFYHRLLLERFLNELPADSSARYSATIFNRQTAKLFNDEMLHTIETFFENSLNLSETARKLYIHRNTLVYRLEKVQRTIGLDLRSFDDAVTFKMMMLLGKNAQPHKNRL